MYDLLFTTMISKEARRPTMLGEPDNFFWHPHHIIESFFPLQQAHPLLPEIKIHKLLDVRPLVEAIEAGNVPSIWGRNLTYGIAYTGGVFLARHILDHPEIVEGKWVADLGAGSGIVALAADIAGANHVAAYDHDPIAVEFTRLNMFANRACLHIVQKNVLEADLSHYHCIAAADIFVHQRVSGPLQERLIQQAAYGKTVLAASGGFLAPRIMKYGTPLPLPPHCPGDVPRPAFAIRLG